MISSFKMPFSPNISRHASTLGHAKTVPEHIAVLGGGITGLSSAFHLSRRFPNSRITLVEKEDRVGGWIRSERVTVKTPTASSSILLEAGPRTLRPVDKALLELIHLLDLTPQLITTPKSSPAAKSRFLHVPELSGGRGLLRVPTDLWSLLSPWSESRPLSRILLPAILAEPFRTFNRRSVINGSEEDIDDESVDSFLTRRFGQDFARVFGSALVHGIYACDSRDLSARAAFPSLWDAELRGNGSILLGLVRHATTKEEEAYQVGNLVEKMKDVSVFSFREGIETLPKALERYLASKENVRILKGTCISGLRIMENDRIEAAITNSSKPQIVATHVVSALPLPVLNNILSSSPVSQQLPHLSNPSSTVTVVNLVFPTSPENIHPAGFGYLVPCHPDTNHKVLPIIGAVFDSCSLLEQDDPPMFTKMTVMIKGDFSLLPSSMSTPPPIIPDLIHHILSSLSIHLSSSLPDPVLWRVHVNHNCIPTYMPGHKKRMAEMTGQVTKTWKERLKVVGSGVGGVSVGDCVKAGRSIGCEWIQGRA